MCWNFVLEFNVLEFLEQLGENLCGIEAIAIANSSFRCSGVPHPHQKLSDLESTLTTPINVTRVMFV